MKTLKDHIDEALKMGKNLSNFSTYSCQPADKKELKNIIEERINKEGPECDLNDIDVSLVTDMSYLFYNTIFNGDISKWDVSKVTDMSYMFKYSLFNGDISKWNVSNVESMADMFNKSRFNGDISDWNVSNVKQMGWMFAYSKFDGDLSKWNVDNKCATGNMFYECPIQEKHKPLLLQLL